MKGGVGMVHVCKVNSECPELVSTVDPIRDHSPSYWWWRGSKLTMLPAPFFSNRTVQNGRFGLPPSSICGPGPKRVWQSCSFCHHVSLMLYVPSVGIFLSLQCRHLYSLDRGPHRRRSSSLAQVKGFLPWQAVVWASVGSWTLSSLPLVYKHAGWVQLCVRCMGDIGS